MAISTLEHMTNRESGRVFTYALPTEWICRSEEGHEDYGIDFEIQFTEQGNNNSNNYNVLPDILKIQLKGTKSKYCDIVSKKLQSENKASFVLKREQLKDYSNFEIPVFLVYVFTNEDNKKSRIFWVNLQNNKEIQDFLKNETSESKTITLPNEFELDDNGKIINSDEFKKEYKNILHYLWSGKVRPLSDYSDEALDNTERKDEKQLFDVMVEKLYRKIDAKKELTSEDAERLYYFLLFCNTFDFPLVKDRIVNLLDNNNCKEFAGRFLEFVQIDLYSGNENLNTKQRILREIIQETSNDTIRYQEDGREDLEGNWGKYIKECGRCGNTVEIDGINYKEGYFECDCSEDGVNVICRICESYGHWVDKGDFNNNGEYEICEHRTIQIDRFK